MSSTRNTYNYGEKSSKLQNILNTSEKVKPSISSNANKSGNNKANKNGSGVAGEADPDDPCVQKIKEQEKMSRKKIIRTVGEDPRFQQQNQTLRCFVSYIDFFRCEKILGEEHEACTWFKQSYTTFCPSKWIDDFDEARKEGRFPWHRNDQGKFPGHKYG